MIVQLVAADLALSNTWSPKSLKEAKEERSHCRYLVAVPSFLERFPVSLFIRHTHTCGSATVELLERMKGQNLFCLGFILEKSEEVGCESKRFVISRIEKGR